MSSSQYEEPWRGLPPELRTRIWDLSMYQPAGVSMVVPNRNSHAISNRTLVPRDELFPSILRTSRETYEVASKSLYSNMFYMDGTCHAILRFLERLPRHYRLMIRKLKLPQSAVFFDDVDNRCHGDLIKLLTGDETRLESVTIPVLDKKPQFYIDALFCELGQAVFRGRLQQLRLYCPDAVATRANDPETIDEILSTADIYSEYERSIEDEVCTQMLVGYFGLTLTGYGAAGHAPEPTRLREIRQNMPSVMQSYRALYPFTVSVGQLEAGEVGMVIVVQTGSVGAARCRIQDVQDRIDRGELDGDSYEERLSLHPLKVPKLSSRLVMAREGLDRFEQQLLHAQR